MPEDFPESPLSFKPLPHRTAGSLAGILAFLTFLAGVLTADLAGNYPALGPGPGLTLDEVFNVSQGVYLLRSMEAYGFGILVPQSQQEIYEHPNYNPDHPPFGRIWLGIAHDLTSALAPPAPPVPVFSTAAARFGSLLAFSLIVLLISWTAARWYGIAGGLGAGLGILLMPRLFAHAHLASLETVMGLMYSLTVLTVIRTGEAPHNRGRLILAGVCLGLAMLTKIQGALLVPPIGIWVLVHRRKQGLFDLAILGSTAFVVFCAGWPWLWIDPIQHFAEYLGRTTNRVSLPVYYFGTVWRDHAVPWHYPWVMFLITIPVGLLFLGGWGIASRQQPCWTSPREQLVLACLLFPLLVFTVPGVAVYDGARLFLVSFPLWGLLIGKGTQLASRRLDEFFQAKPISENLPSLKMSSILTLFLLLQSFGLITSWPVSLSYYNLLTGGLAGANRLGMERSYWGDSITRDLLEEVAAQVPSGTVVHFSPVPHPAHLAELTLQSPILARRGIQFTAWDPRQEQDVQYLLVFHRQADLLPEFADSLSNFEEIATVQRQGVSLATFARPKSPKLFGNLERTLSATTATVVGGIRADYSPVAIDRFPKRCGLSLSHFDSTGASRMVNVGEKPVTHRLARAEGFVQMATSTLQLIQDRKLAKGDVLEVARLAGIMGSKRTSDLIPLCHPLGLDSVEIQFAFPADDTLRIEAVASVHAKTGVEMEALTAVSVAALTVYDMCKAVDREMSIGPIRLLEKLGGKSGHFHRTSAE